MQTVKNITSIKYFLDRFDPIDQGFSYNVNYHSIASKTHFNSLPTFVADFYNCSTHSLPLLVTEDDHLITEHVWPLIHKYKNKPQKIHNLFTKWGETINIDMPPVTKQFDETYRYVWLPIDEYSAENPWHIWIDVISKFRLLEKKNGLPFAKYVYIMSNPSKYFDNVAKELFPSVKYYVMPKNSVWRFSHLLVPSTSNYLDGITTPNMPPWLRHFGYKNKQKPYRKIFITRKGSSNRNITNQEQLLLALKGWETVTLNNLSIKEQIKTFAEATHILSPHSAGLINLLWCAKGTKIIEIQHKEWIDKKVYPILSHHLGLKHIVYLAETEKVTIKKPKNKKLKDMVNLKVNIPLLLKHLD